MKKNRFRSPFHSKFDHLIYRVAETSEGATEGDGTDTEFDPKAFAETTSATIATLQKELNSGKKTTATELANIKKTLGDITVALQALNPQTQDDDAETEGTETEEETPPKTTKRTTRAKTTTTEDNPEITELKKTLANFQKTLETEKKRGDAAEERYQAAETRRLHAERDRQLIAAATSLGAIDANDVADFLRSKSVYDEDTESWVIKDGDGTLDLSAGVKKFTPKYMVKAKSTAGGAGGHSTGEENGASKATLRQNAIAAGRAAQKNPTLMARYTKAKNDYVASGGDVTEIIDEVSNVAV
jgi:hypothetical protein